jgi:hypothetical protein
MDEVRYSTDDGFEERILDAQNAAMERSDDDDERDAAAELRAKAAQHEQDAADSFERCDTDGFVSQWASGLNAQVARANAQIAEDGGMALFERTLLCTLDGEIVQDARVVRTRFGERWRIDRTDEWLPYRPARESTLAKYGYREIEQEAVGPAKAITWSPSGGRGLSGATSVTVRVFRTDAEKSEGWRHVGSPADAGGVS